MMLDEFSGKKLCVVSTGRAMQGMDHTICSISSTYTYTGTVFHRVTFCDTYCSHDGQFQIAYYKT